MANKCVTCPLQVALLGLYCTHVHVMYYVCEGIVMRGYMRLRTATSEERIMYPRWVLLCQLVDY